MSNIYNDRVYAFFTDTEISYSARSNHNTFGLYLSSILPRILSIDIDELQTGFVCAIPILYQVKSVTLDYWIFFSAEP